MFDVTVAPSPMVRALGAWVGLDWVDPSLPDALQRRIVAEYFSLLSWRGTRRGMKQLLELISGAPAVVEERGGIYPEGESPPDAGHVVLRVESSGWATNADLLRIVEAELPASATFELFVGGERIWPASPEGGSSTAIPGGDVMAEIVCPECGLVTSLTAIRRNADEFCKHCDYPLFSAPTALPLVAGATASDATLRRLPGAGGRMMIGTLVCPACGELNPMSEVWCIRCSSPLHPVPEEPLPEPPPPAASTTGAAARATLVVVAVGAHGDRRGGRCRAAVLRPLGLRPVSGG